jgi:hypothetical protein
MKEAMELRLKNVYMCCVGIGGVLDGGHGK